MRKFFERGLTVKKSGGWWKGVLKYILGVGLLAFVVGSNWTSLNNLFRNDPQVMPFVYAAITVMFVIALQYFRWYILVRALDLPFALKNAVRLGLVGTFYNTFLPGSVGGDIVKAYFIAQGQPNRKAAAVATVIADRMVGLFGLILFAAAIGGSYWASGDERIAANRTLQIIISVCIGLATIAALTYTSLGLLPQKRADRFGERLKSVRKIGGTLAELWYAAWQYRQRPLTVLAAIGLSAVAHTGMMFSYHFAVQVFPPANPELLGTLPEHFVIAPIGFIVQALIPVPGGLGGGELTFGGLYVLIRGPLGEPVGLAGRLALRLIEWCVGLIGYIAYLRMKAELPVEDAETSLEEKEQAVIDITPPG